MPLGVVADDLEPRGLGEDQGRERGQEQKDSQAANRHQKYWYAKRTACRKSAERSTGRPRPANGYSLLGPLVHPFFIPKALSQSKRGLGLTSPFDSRRLP